MNPNHHPTHLEPTPITPTALIPATTTAPARRQATEPMVWVPGPNGDFIAVPRSVIPADYFTPPAPAPALAPASFAAGIDHRAQILAAGGIGAGAAGWGAGQLVSAVAGLGTAGLAALALLILAARMPRRAPIGRPQNGPNGGDHTEIHVHKGGRVKALHVHIR